MLHRVDRNNDVYNVSAPLWGETKMGRFLETLRGEGVVLRMTGRGEREGPGIPPYGEEILHNARMPYVPVSAI